MGETLLGFLPKLWLPGCRPTALGPFLTKLAEQGYSIQDKHNAAQAVRLLLCYDPPERNLYIELSAPASSPKGGIVSATAGQSLSRLSGEPRGPAALEAASWEREYLDLETELKLRNYSPKTFNVYRFWVSRFQAFVHTRPTPDVEPRPSAPPTWLRTDRVFAPLPKD